MSLSYLYCQQPVLQVIHQALVVILSSSQGPGCGNEEHEHRLHCERLSFFVGPAFSLLLLTRAQLFPRSLSRWAERAAVTARRGKWGGRRARAGPLREFPIIRVPWLCWNVFTNSQGGAPSLSAPLPSSRSQCAALTLQTVHTLPGM